ncbi:unnamed protein product [Phytophthora fragariaefolia]|uniref:Unnamed protein product n=1 Tax=Phytophthora fragariaefolia TaxID=1490495 RepID=A0A9W6XKF1_9STRA|nr:unnamed protein product [Phytophthora fragariaefolia]
MLVLKDSMSGYVELIECARATSEYAYQGLIDWFKRFGVVHTWDSDQGPHFTREGLTGCVIYYERTTAYSPWANGSVEVVNRLLLRRLKAMASELKLQIKQWPTLLPLVQSALNGMPSNRLGAIAPITAFAGLPGSSQPDAIFPPTFAENCSLSWIEKQQQKHLRDVRTALDAIRQQCSAASSRKNAQARGRRANKPGVRMAKFAIGDFVLAASAVKGGSKLALLWRGPNRIVRSLNDYTFEVQDLCAPYGIVVRHASRLQFYRDSERGVTEDLIAHALRGEGGHLFDKLL